MPSHSELGSILERFLHPETETGLVILLPGSHDQVEPTRRVQSLWNSRFNRMRRCSVGFWIISPVCGETSDPMTNAAADSTFGRL
jgi:hypothetical protein